MSDLFDDDDDLLEDVFSPDDTVPVDSAELSESTVLDARRRLEQALEEKRLRDELNDFVDY
ncbi:PA3496 family putative envelope integrity protein [Legionella gresilensis]|uniref:PA3496 family putative envelope integrity protein n=1 Tax=Legionella gresilensis TaxID=91823 RepID=UPI0010413CEE|nr:hypothetical protein [Legionella gresilensis]